VRSSLVLFTSRLEPSPDLGSSRLGSWTRGLEGSSRVQTWTRGLEPGSSRQETAKKPPRGSSLESSRLVDPCPSRLEPPRDSSPLVDPCSSRQETGCQETRAGLARGTPGLEGLEPGSARVWLESAWLVHNTNPHPFGSTLTLMRCLANVHSVGKNTPKQPHMRNIYKLRTPL